VIQSAYDSRSTAAGDTAVEPAPREIDSDSLLGGARELHIRHGDQRYVLRRTGKGGLILTK